MKKLDLTRIPGQGEDRKPSDEMMNAIVDGLETVRHESSADIWQRRLWADNVRYCQWAGQSPDGRKREDYLGEPPFPFEGASDSRYRLADFILKLQVATLKQSVKRASVRIRGLEAGDAKTAEQLNTLATWLLNNRMAGSWRMHIERLAQWGLGDSPAVSLLHVYQDRRDVLRMRNYSVEDLAVYLQEIMMGEEGMVAEEPMIMEGADFASLLMDKERQEELISIIIAQFPQLRPATVRKSLKELREKGEAKFPVVEVERNEPRIEALRMWKDVFCPVYTRDPEDCRVVYVRRWMSLAQLEEKERVEGWVSAAIDELTGREDDSQGAMGKSYVWEQEGSDISATRDFDHSDLRDGMFEVVTAYITGTNDDGVPGVFTLHFSGFVDVPLTKLQLLDYPHGGLPFVWYVREYVSENLLDARGVCELVQTDQDFLKHMRDLSADHAQLFTLPPFTHNMMSPEREIRFSSLSLIRVGPTGALSPVSIPKSDDLPLQHSQSVRREISNYFGVPLEEINSAIGQLITQDMVDDFMDVIRQALLMLMQLAVHYMDQDEIADVVGAGEGFDVQVLREGTRKLRDIEIDFTAAVLDSEYLQTLSGIIKDTLLTIDSEQTIMRNELVDWLCRQIHPNLANKILRPVEEASQEETRDEEINFSLMKAGVEPPMREDGQNFQARLDVLLGKLDDMDRKPDLKQGWTETNLQILQARIQHLQGQVQQGQNAIIGRQMGQQVLAR